MNKSKFWSKVMNIRIVYYSLRGMMNLARGLRNININNFALVDWLNRINKLFGIATFITLIVFSIILTTYIFEVPNVITLFRNSIWHGVDRSVQKTFIIHYTIDQQLRFWQLDERIIRFIFTFVAFIVVQVFLSKLIAYLNNNLIVLEKIHQTSAWKNWFSIKIQKLRKIQIQYVVFLVILILTLLTAPTLTVSEYKNFRSNLYWLYDPSAQTIYYGAVNYLAMILISLSYLSLIGFFAYKIYLMRKYFNFKVIRDKFGAEYTITGDEEDDVLFDNNKILDHDSTIVEEIRGSTENDN
ncbi:hypothetical protein J2Z62_000591 [Mycoplasmoides fastidiosum]|uniref:Glycerophosphoryl diester phosphodiesterase membrane domain-containing protein n=1 Tax=Mycoplasmoides fastidiosum TaxID=92758 RepID=A0ABU0LZX6_9BACT|nr:hypothetical protein [Mycoplasmoides fastidiosum]MDQ0514153.1 hypothetical protein [Mycoplasmoides fastidiosum]UUD37439.1 hypothetical protein NPA10_02575 [Mycoplasmoides fastidiosum]